MSLYLWRFLMQFFHVPVVTGRDSTTMTAHLLESHYLLCTVCMSKLWWSWWLMLLLSWLWLCCGCAEDMFLFQLSLSKLPFHHVELMRVFNSLILFWLCLLHMFCSSSRGNKLCLLFIIFFGDLYNHSNRQRRLPGTLN